MSFDHVAKKEFDMLSEEQQVKIVELMILFNKQNTSVQKKKRRNFPFDLLKDGKEYMSDDFDEIPEGFEEYT